MPRILRIAACQVGATHKSDRREDTIGRLLQLLDNAAAEGAQLALFPEIAFTTFFPRYFFEGDEIDKFFEHGDVTIAAQTKPLFDKARDLGVDICVGFTEADPTLGSSKLAMDGADCFNSCIYYHSKSGSILSKYRKIHLPGDFEPFENPNAINQLEKRYFKPGNLGFKAFRVPDLIPYNTERGEPILGMMICNDRSWSEAWRVLGLQGVEVVLCGYNTNGFAPEMWGKSTDGDPTESENLGVFQHQLVMQSNSYTNSCFSVSAARCGKDDGKFSLIAGSCITDPDGKIIARSKTKDDEVIYADCDLELCRPHKLRTFNFGKHRRVEHYGRITAQTGVVEPPHLAKSLAGGVNDDLVSQTYTNTIGPLDSQIKILLINPNATPTMTNSCLSMLKSQLPPDVSVTGFTAPSRDGAPSAIEGQVDKNLQQHPCGLFFP
ncbi:carbon-nitrogen hydrolase [Tothia fuscella]|uniref:Carbon-nitrogen hydrolase n=1 Tax=Tothia fuscella TaxID=1048955 RepID=A0A9P4NE95_9PEZI|nr:carbon-nitrogen hydrolase [Tothia fuscella]